MTYLPSEYGSAEFRSAYEAAIAGDKKRTENSGRHSYGTFNWLIEEYRRSPVWLKLAPISRRNLLNELERFRTKSTK